MNIKDSNNLKILTNYISEVLKVDIILCLGTGRWTVERQSLLQTQPVDHTQFHYDLLVVSDTEVLDIVKLQNDCCNETKMTVNLLIHTGEEVAHLLAEGNRFFHTIFKKADHLYLASSFQDMLDKISIAGQPYGALVWEDHYAKALHLHQSAEKMEDPNTAVDLIVESMEIICIGLLRSRLGYNPQHTGLAYLLPLCGLISNKFYRIFSTGINELLLLQTKDHIGHLSGGSLLVSVLHQQFGEFLKAVDAFCNAPTYMENQG